MGTLQQRLLELDGTVEELEHDKARVRRAYDQLMEQASKTVDAMDSEIQVCLTDWLLPDMIFSWLLKSMQQT